MSNATTYDVRLRYSVDGRAARDGTRGVIKDAKELQQSTDRVTSSMVRMGAAIVAAFGARSAGKALIEFNSTVEDTKNQIAGMLALAKKTDLSDELGNADRLFANLQKRAATLPGTTMEYAQMAGMLTQPLTDAGLGMKDLEDLTVNTVVAAKALRVESGAAARDVDQALRGQYHSTDVFTGKLLGSMGYSGEAGRAKYNALDADKRADELKKAVMQKQIGELADAQGQTFSGVLSTLQDTVEQTLGKIGLPLFKAITSEIKRWNTYLDKNGDTVGKWVDKLGTGLVDAFHVVKDSIGFIVDHADLLIMIAKTWALVKIGGAITGGATSLLGGSGSGGKAASGLLGAIAGARAWGSGSKDSFDENGGYKYQGPGAGRTNVTGSNIAGALPMLGQAAAAGYALGTIINEQTDAGKNLTSALEILHPRVDAASQRFYQLEASSDRLHEAQERAAKDAEGKGFGAEFGGVTATNMTGEIEKYKADVAAFDQLQQEMSKGATTNWLGQAVARDSQKAAMDAFAARGVSGADIGKERSEIPRLQALQDSQSSRAQQAWLSEFQTLNATELKQLDVQQSQERVLQYIKSGGLLDGMARDNPFKQALGGFVDDVAVGMIMHGDGSKAKMAEKPKVNVTIQRIEVQSDDPDRFAFGMINAFRDAAKNPSAAISALREG